MRVHIAQIDGKWPNLALAKLVAMHREQGDEVDWFNPMIPAHVTYAAKVFIDTPGNQYLPEGAVRGGSGYDPQTGVVSSLSRWTEELRPDWSLWPWWKKDMGFTTRGCVRRCPFCIVPKKEGKLRVVAEFGDVWTGRRDLVLLDANITAAPIEHLRRLCADATRAGVRLDFSQGFDARLLTDEQARLIVEAPHARTLHMAFDNLRDEAAVRRAIALWSDAGLNVRHDLMVFVLVGFDTTEAEDLYRVELLRDLGANPFVMPFDRRDRYQRRLARWVNRPKLFRSCSWADFGKVKA